MWRIILCDSNGKETQMLWEFVFDIKEQGMHLTLNEPDEDDDDDELVLYIFGKYWPDDGF